MRRRRSSKHDETNTFSTAYAGLAKGLLAAALVLGLAEWGAGLVMGKIRDNRASATPSLTDQDIARLYDTDNPGIYRQVLAETEQLGEAVYSPLVEYRLPVRAGRHVTVTAEGYRGNGAAQDLDAPGGKVFVFGGSTTFGSGVADSETLPAQLGEVLKVSGKDVQVFNFGAPSYYSTVERIALERMLTNGQRPDLAIFVDGLSDFQACQLPDRTAWSERLEQATAIAARLPMNGEFFRRSHLLAFGRWLIGDEPAEAPNRAAMCASDAEVDKVIRRLDTNRRILTAMADKLGFKVLFVQQPVPTYHYDNSKRPVPVDIELLAHQQNSAKGYPRMVEMQAGGQLLADHTLWLAELEPTQGNAYVDTVHYSPRFNRAIAEAVGRTIVDNALLP